MIRVNQRQNSQFSEQKRSQVACLTWICRACVMIKSQVGPLCCPSAPVSPLLDDKRNFCSWYLVSSQGVTEAWF